MPPGKVKRPAAIRKPRRKSLTPKNTVFSGSPVGPRRKSLTPKNTVFSGSPVGHSQLDDEIITTTGASSRKGTSAVIMMVVLAAMTLAVLFSQGQTVKPGTTTKAVTTTTTTTTTKAAVPRTISSEPATTTMDGEKTLVIMLAVGIVLSTAAYCYFSDRSSLASLMAFVIFMYVCVAFYNWAVSNSDAIQQNAYRWAVAGLGIFVALVCLASTFVFQIGTAFFMMLGSMIVSAAYFMLAKGTDFVGANAAMLSRLGLVVFLAMATYWKFGGVGAFVMAFCAASLISISLPVDDAPAAVAEPGKSSVVDYVFFNKDTGDSSPVLKEPLSLVDSFVAALASLPMLVLIVAFPMILTECDSETTSVLVFNLLAVTTITVVVHNGYFWDVTLLRPPSTIISAAA